MQVGADQADRVRSASKSDRVEVALAYFIDALQQLIDVVMLRVQVAAGERVIAAGRELADQLGASSGGVHGASSGTPPAVSSVCTKPGLKKKTGIRPASSLASISP